jgi:hypothetical protein
MAFSGALALQRRRRRLSGRGRRRTLFNEPPPAQSREREGTPGALCSRDARGRSRIFERVPVVAEARGEASEGPGKCGADLERPVREQALSGGSQRAGLGLANRPRFRWVWEDRGRSVPCGHSCGRIRLGRHIVYVTIRNYAGNSEIVDRLVSRADEVKQLITGISGFQAYYLVRTDGGGVSVSVYDSRDGADESNRQAAEFIRSNFPDLASASPQVSAGETVITA